MFLRRLRRHRPGPPLSARQGEEYQVEKAEREARKQRDRFAASLFEKVGHLQYPFLKDPFE